MSESKHDGQYKLNLVAAKLRQRHEVLARLQHARESVKEWKNLYSGSQNIADLAVTLKSSTNQPRSMGMLSYTELEELRESKSFVYERAMKILRGDFK